jgi:hypothetical protein
LFTKRQESTAAAAHQESEVTDTDKAARQNMQQKAAQKLIDR